MDIVHGCAYSRKLVPSTSFHYAPSTSLRSSYTCAVEGIQFKQAALARFQILAVKNEYHAHITTSSLPKGHHEGTFELVINELPSRVHRSQFSIQSSPEKSESEKILDADDEHQEGNLEIDICNRIDDASGSAESTSAICDREMQRRRKIGVANKGRVPWNKGRTHSKETRERISKRTVEALNDPKVMSC